MVFIHKILYFVLYTLHEHLHVSSNRNYTGTLCGIRQAEVRVIMVVVVVIRPTSYLCEKRTRWIRRQCCFAKHGGYEIYIQNKVHRSLEESAVLCKWCHNEFVFFQYHLNAKHVAASASTGTSKN